MDKKIIAYIIMGVIVLLLILGSFGVINIRSGSIGNSGNSNVNNNIPEECKVPAGQDIESWKEHLSHHENTLYCLEYFKSL